MARTKTKPSPDNGSVKATEQELGNAFLEAYKELCEKHGFELMAVPNFMHRDDGSFSIMVGMQIARVPEQNGV